MPMTPLTAASLVCARSDWQISNLKLQKILYLAQMAYMGDHNGQPLIDGRFQAWDYGPVLPEVYNIASVFGRKAIGDRFVRQTEIDEEEKKALLTYTDALLQYSAAELVGITHWKNGAWAKNYVPGEKGIVISSEDILEEHRSRVAFVEKEGQQTRCGRASVSA